MSETLLLSERIAADGITIHLWQLSGPPESERDPLPDWRWWDVMLRMRGGEEIDDREFEIPFGLGPAAGDEPDVVGVMSSVCIGVRAVQDALNYQDWCSEWGLDPEDEGRLADYEEWERIAGRLFVFLGNDLFDAYMWETLDDT